MADETIKTPATALNTPDLTPEQAIEAVKGASSNHSQSTFPVGFNWPLSGAPWDSFLAVKNGDSYECSVKPSDLIDLSTFTNTIYVDRSALDGLDGSSWALAENRIHQAIDAANASGVPTKILIKAGTYERGYDFNNSTTRSLSVPIAFIAQYGEVEVGCFDKLSWSQNATYSNVYEAARSNASHVIDPSMRDGFGNELKYKNVSTLLECSTTPCSWYSDNVTVYVNNDFYQFVSDRNARVFLDTLSGSLSGNQDVYMNGIYLQGGNSGAINPHDGSTNTYVLENCKFRHAASGNVTGGFLGRDGAQILGLKLLAAYNCDASSNSKDGFNIHEQSGVFPSLLSVNCKSFNNGQIITTSQSNNGITVHDGCRAIEIGGRWLGSIGTNSGHINDNTQVWQFGSVAGNSDGDVINGGSIDWGAFGVWSGAAELWVEHCQDVGSAIGLYAGSGATVRYRNHDGLGSFSGSGTIVEF